MTHPVDVYARAIVAGELPAGKYHKLACLRHERDRAREGTPEFPYVFDEERANHFFRFAEKLKHYKGEWVGLPIHLEPWQLFLTGSVIGWVHRDTRLRRFRTAFNQVPRKNGKTLIAAVMLLYLTFFDGEAGAEGYSIATKRDQAKLVFADCRRLVVQDTTGLKSRITVRMANLHQVRTASKLEPLGADHDSTDGLNPSVVVVDEMHAMKDRGLLDVLETATGARRQPMMYEITTFGNSLESTWGHQHSYAAQILEGVLTDETFFTFSAHADPTDDWMTPETARKANPNYGISVNPEDLASKVLKAQGIPEAAATYKQKHLNLLVTSFDPCLSLEGWRAGQSDWTIDAMQHEPCYVGVDLASRIDLCALSFLFPPSGERTSWRLSQRIWTPADTARDRAHRDRAPYPLWGEQGWLTLVPGTSIDHDLVRQALVEARDRFDILQIGFDPWHAEAPIKNLIAHDGFDETQVIPVPQSFAGMSAGCLRVQADILAGTMDARRCPVTTWAVSNVVGVKDGKDNLMFSKKHSRGRIDPVTAATIAMNLAIRHQAEPQVAVLAEWM